MTAGLMMGGGIVLRAGVVLAAGCLAPILAGIDRVVAQTVAPLPPVSVDAPKRQAAAAAPRQGAARQQGAARRSATRATGQRAATPPAPTSTPARETAWGPVRGFVAARSATGTKTDTPLIETPQSISVVTAEQIRDTGARTIGEALSYTAGVQTQPYGFDARYDQFNIRGFSANQFGNYRDGLRQANGAFAYFRNEPYGLERVEVLRGPTSVLYGANDPGGMVNMVSKMPLEQRLNEIGLDIGNYDRYQGKFDFSGPVPGNDNVLYRFVGLFRDSGTQVPNAPDNRIFFAPSVTAKINDDTRLTILSEYEQSKNSMWPYYLRLPGVGVTNILLSDPSFDTLSQSQESIGYRLEHRPYDNVTLRQNFRVGHVDWQGDFVDAAGLSGTTLDRYSGRFKEHLNTVNLDNQMEVKLATGPVRHTVLAGVDYFWQDTDLNMAFGSAPSLNLLNPVYSTGPVGNFAPAVANYQTLDQTGVYLQDQMALGGWRLTLGGRQDFATLNSTDQLQGSPTFGVRTQSNPEKATWRAGLLYLFDNGVAPYVNYATSFLPQSGVTAPARGAQPFLPATGESFEAGIKFQPAGWNSYMTVAWFNLTKDNVLTTDPIYGSLYSVQTGQIRSRGVEVEGVASLTAGLKAIASYSYTDALVTRSNDVDLNKVPLAVPTNQAAIFLDYTWQSGLLAGFGGGAGARYIGETWADTINTIRNPAITAIDAGLHYDYRNLRFAVNGRNIFDQRVGICNGGNCTFSTGRTVLGSMTARW